MKVKKSRVVESLDGAGEDGENVDDGAEKRNDGDAGEEPSRSRSRE